MKKYFNYGNTFLLKITYSNFLPLEKMKKILYFDIKLCGINVGRVFCNTGENTVIFDISEYLKCIDNEYLKVDFNISYLWKPYEYIDDNFDHRELGVAISEIAIFEISI